MWKKIIIGVVIVLAVVISFQFFSKNGEEKIKTVAVEKGSVFSEIAETGQVQKGDKINLSFRNSGKVSEIYIKTGDTVEKGALLMKLDVSSLSIQLKESESALNIAQVQLDKLIAGSTPEERQKYQTAVNNKEIALNVAKQSLLNANEDALNVLEDAYLKAYNAYVTVNELQITYFKKIDQEGIVIRENKSIINSAVNEIKDLLNSLKAEFSQENVDSSLSNIKSKLSEISSALTEIRETCESANYRNAVSATYKTSLDTHRGYINTVLTSITNDSQAVASAKLAINTAEGNLQAAKDDLAFIVADPRKEDISLYQTQVSQAQSQIDVLNNQISDSYLKSPVKGQVAEITKRVGELAQASLQDMAVVILPADPYKIEVNIYEEDVINIDIDNYVEIVLVAFPNDIFTGKVISINPAEELVDGVVYYNTVIAFDETPKELKPGMTADVMIRPEIRENVLFVPEESIYEKDGKMMVKVLLNEEIKEIEVELGLEGNDNVEIISGLKEGELVIIE